MRSTPTLKPVSSVPAAPRPMHVLDSAETVSFDAAPVFSSIQGNISLTLTTRRFIPDGQGGVLDEDVVVGFLRCSPPAAMSLRRAIDAALLLASRAKDGPSN